jgi:hypothetical protein
VANTLNSFRSGAVGFIEWLDGRRGSRNGHESTPRIVRDMRIEVDKRFLWMKRVVQVDDRIAAPRMEVGRSDAGNAHGERSSVVFRSDETKAASHICDCCIDRRWLRRAENEHWKWNMCVLACRTVEDKLLPCDRSERLRLHKCAGDLSLSTRQRRRSAHAAEKRKC